MIKPLSDMTEPELRETMKGAADVAVAALPAGALFVILAFEGRTPGISQYISNCDRRTMIHALRETADRLELSQDVTR